MSDWRERTAEEREAARLERERRRARRSGAAPEPRYDHDHDPEPEPGFDHDPEPAFDHDHDPELEPGFDHDPEPAFDHDHEPDPRFDHEPEPAFDHEPGPVPAFDDDADPAEEEDGADPLEVPAGTRRVARAERLQSRPPREAAPRRTRRTRRTPSRPRRGPAQPVGARRSRRRIVLRVVTVCVLALALAGIWFLYELFQPFHGSGHGEITVTIPPHEGASKVGDLLARDGVVSSGFFFDVRAAVEGDRGNLRAGTYHLKLGMSYGAVLKILTTPPPAAQVSELTIAEGDTRARVASLLRAQHVRGAYLVATRRSRLLNPRAYGAPRSLPSLEGFLFPDTYQLVDPIKIDALVADQLRTFKRRFATVNLSYARSNHLTPFDVLTIASIVQGEAQTLHDMPLIASVIYNRLRDHMLLQMDSTTRYAAGNFTTPLTESQLRSRSPYNTYVQPGLPLGPINNPGMAAIEAAAHPARTSYLYFVAKVCGNGASVFASSYAQFQHDKQQYQVARQNRGGKSPTHC